MALRLTVDQVVSCTVGELAAMIKAAGPGGLSETGCNFRFGFLMSAVRRFLAGEGTREQLEQDLLLVMSDQDREQLTEMKARNGGGGAL